MFNEAQITRRTDDASYLDKFVLVSVQEHGTLNIVDKVTYRSAAEKNNLKILDKRPSAEQVDAYKLRRAARKRASDKRTKQRNMEMSAQSNDSTFVYIVDKNGSNRRVKYRSAAVAQKSIILEGVEVLPEDLREYKERMSNSSRKYNDKLRDIKVAENIRNNKKIPQRNFYLADPKNKSTIEKIISLAKEGYTGDAISTRVGLNVATVTKVAMANKVKIHHVNNAMFEKYREKGSFFVAKELLEAGMNIHEISEETNLSTEYIRVIEKAFQVTKLRANEDVREKNLAKLEPEMVIIEDKPKHYAAPVEIPLKPLTSLNEDYSTNTGGLHKVSSPTNYVDYAFPLSDGRKISIQIPTNLTDREAQRFGQFISSLVV
jgi:hypothetical protein